MPFFTTGMIIDGRSIALRIRKELKEEIEKLSSPLTLTHFIGTDDKAIESFVKIKRKVADELGIKVIEEDVRNLNTEQLIEKIEETEGKTDGVILQFPLYSKINAIEARKSIPTNLDVDVISDNSMKLFEEGDFPILPPVVGAIKEIIDEYKIEIKGKKVLIIGKGWLVGVPSSIWFKKEGCDVTSLTSATENISDYTKVADIIVLGAGSPGLLKPEMIKEGVVIFDAGTSEEGGKMIGDAQSSCAEKSGFFTPVPGGIGPITVAILFKNLLKLSENR